MILVKTMKQSPLHRLIGWLGRGLSHVEVDLHENKSRDGLEYRCRAHLTGAPDSELAKQLEGWEPEPNLEMTFAEDHEIRDAPQQQ